MHIAAIAKITQRRQFNRRAKRAKRVTTATGGDFGSVIAHLANVKIACGAPMGYGVLDGREAQVAAKREIRAVVWVIRNETVTPTAVHD